MTDEGAVQGTQMRISKDTWARLWEEKIKHSKDSTHVLTFDEIINLALDALQKEEAA
jgi:uncharacterized protein (DUF2384 family)